MIRRALAILFLTSVAWAEMTQVPFQEKDPKTNENFRNIYYQVDALDSNISEIETSLANIQGSAGFKNRIINPSFSINQRSTTTATDDAYHLDRWYALTQTSTVTVAQQTEQENGQLTNLRMTQPGASAQRIGVAQIVESINSIDLRGVAVTLSARIRCSASQAIRYAILESTITADTVTSDVVSSWTSTDFTAGNFFISSITVANTGSTTPTAATWTSVSLTATLTSNVKNLLVFFWSEDTLAQNETLDIGSVQLEIGSTATPFATRDYESELSLCRRYYEKSYDPLTAPGTATSIGNETVRRGVAGETATFFPAKFLTLKRATPTVTWYNPNTGTSAQIYDASAAANVTVTGASTIAPVSRVRPGAPTHAGSGAAGAVILGQWVAVTEL